MPNLEELTRNISNRIMYRSANLVKKDTEQRSDAQTHDASFVLISNNNQTERFDWWEGETYIEELNIDGADYSQLRTFFKDHNPSVDNAIGKIENARVENGELIADVVFGSDEHSQTIKQKYNDGILTDVSIGYRINDITETKNKDKPNHIMVEDFTIVELSAVWKGADVGAVKIKEAEEKRYSFELYAKKNNIRTIQCN